MPDQPVVTIHHMERSRSKRIVWLMEELDVPYRLESYRRGPDLLAESDYRALHPFAHAPIITDGDLVLIESGAIVELLLEHYGAGRLAPPPGTIERARYLQWLHFAEGSAMANQTAERIALKLAAGSPTQQIFTTRNEEMLRYLDVELSTRPYLAGAEFTAADIMMEFPLAFCERRLGRSLAPYPNVVAFHRRVTNRPAFARATARVGDSL